MSLNKIQLPAIVVSGLFKNALVKMDEADEKKEAPVHPSYKFLGRNKKNICLFTSSLNAVFVSETHLSFITKLLDACKVNLEDVAIINTATGEVNIMELKKQLNPKKVIFFGVEPTSIKLPIHFPMFKLQEYDGCTYLFVSPLEELNQETNEGRILKSKLWVCLKNLFEL